MIDELVTRRFRNLDHEAFAPGPGRHLILGPNGAGKSSLVEALYVVATTRSFRTSDLASCRRRGSERFEIEFTVGGQRPARMFLARDDDGLERLVDGSRCSLSDHLVVVPVVSWSEADRDVVGGVPEARRRFIDRGVLAERPALVETMSRYRQALANKRAVLRRGGADLGAWNELLAREGAELARARQLHLERAQQHVERLAASMGLAGVLDLEYHPSPGGLSQALPDQGASVLARALEEVSARERETGRALVGPHRDRLTISWRGAEIATAASAGERKLCGWLLTLARAEAVRRTGRSPLVILDDADAELDPERLASAWSLLDETHEVFATSSRPEVWKDCPRSATWALKEGHISRLNH